jgi:imidazole glycerol phosphate synthase glutamine amidotransferase subunit
LTRRHEPVVGLVDYGAGNLVSVRQGLELAGAVVRPVQSAPDLAAIDLLAVPGVGAAAPAMARLEDAGLVEPLRAWLAEDRPFLGICLGLQLLFERSDEDEAVMLGTIPGRVRLLTGGRRLPHIGWNQVERRHDHPAFAGIEDGADFYFVHSYAGQPEGPADDDLVLGETTDGASFVSAIARGRLVGVQFHPERSGPNGLRFLRNVVDLVRHDAFSRRAPTPAAELVG